VDKDEVAGGIGNRLLFLGHFVDFLLKRAGEEFFLTYAQFLAQLFFFLLPILIGAAIVGAIVGGVLGGPGGAVGGALTGFFMVLVIEILISIVVASFNAIKCWWDGGLNRNMVECFNYASATLWVFPVLVPNDGYCWNHPQMFNVDKLSNFWI
jgi:hypothetical protein